MAWKNKNMFKPIFYINQNIQNRSKLLKFKKKKWQKLIFLYRKKLNFYRKIKPKDQIQHVVSRYPGLDFVYKKQHKIITTEVKKIKLAYGGLLNKTLKILFNKNIKIITHTIFLETFENRLDISLYRVKFGPNIKFIRQLIYNGKVFVNNRKIKNQAFLLIWSDIIQIKLNCKQFVKRFTKSSATWPICPKHLIVNYKTMQVICESLKKNNISLNFFYYLNIEKVLTIFRLLFNSSG